MFKLSIRRRRLSFKPKIGVEIHAQLNTTNKLFSPARVDWKASPNSQVSPFDCGTPGTLPDLNWHCIELAIRAALITNSTISSKLLFDRKHYEHWDLPAGYQITQHRQPLATNGYIEIGLDGVESNKRKRKVRIKQIHVEQDSGKSFHNYDDKEIHVDLNRAGVGLIEIVSEPDLQSPQEASLFVQSIHELLQDTLVCSGNLEQGAMRIDVNVNWIDSDSLEPITPRVELKNVNGIGIIESAVICELNRQRNEMKNDKSILLLPQTRFYSPDLKKTFLLRLKDSFESYRYLPEYDLPQYDLPKSFVQEIKKSMPLTRKERIEIILKKYPQLNFEHLKRLWTRPHCLPNLFEQCLKISIENENYDPRSLLNWCIGELLAILNRENFESFHFTPRSFFTLIEAVKSGTLDKEFAKTSILEAIFNSRDLVFTTDTNSHDNLDEALSKEIKDLFNSHPDRVEFLKSVDGKARGSVDFFIGPLMKRFRGKIGVQELANKLKDELNK